MFKTLPGDEVRDFTLINFGEYFKYTGEKLLSKLKEKKSYKSCWTVCSFLTMPDEAKKSVELIGKTLEVKIMMQSSSFVNCVHI